MAKKASRYLDVEPWAVTETGFHPDRALVSESIFSLGNEYMGVRGYFDEGYGGESLRGSYFNGVYDEKPIIHAALFKGMATRMCFLVNAVDWLHTRLRVGGETLDLASSRVSDFTRRLDLRTGVLTRSFVWRPRRGGALRCTFIRFTSMAEPHLGAQRVELESLDFEGDVEAVFGLDFSQPHQAEGRCLWTVLRRESRGGRAALLGRTLHSGQRVLSMMALRCDTAAAAKDVAEGAFAGRQLRLKFRPGDVRRVDRLVLNEVERDAARSDAEIWRSGHTIARQKLAASFDERRAEHAAHWERQWRILDIAIEGDDAAQQGFRYSVFQLYQTYHGVDPRLNISAKGLTGEAYCGWTWWDTETYCLPFHLFTNPAAARNLLGYRYLTLPQALERARQLDCEGARYPMGTIDGTESVGTWQHGDLEIHVSAAVAYGIWHYDRICHDDDFLFGPGIEMLLQICRYYASRGGWSPVTKEFGFYGVMGPDEFHMMVHNNTYTNLMAKKAFEFTRRVAAELQRKYPERWAAVARRVGLRPGELADWKRKAERMRILFDPKTGLFEQHDGYFDLPEINVRAIPPEQMPIYKHWAYVRIFRTCMIKQPDVLLFLLLYSGDFDLAVKRANYLYYEPRCVHESSLSPSVHSILAAELGRDRDAYRYAMHAARLDLDDYNRNTAEGLHTTSMAGAWMNLVYGFGGLRSDGPRLRFAPSCPAAWKGFNFRLRYRGRLLQVTVRKRNASFRLLEGEPLEIEVYGNPVTVHAQELSIPLRKSPPGNRTAQMPLGNPRQKSAP